MVEVNEQVSTAVHPTALVDPTAELGDGVSIGPFAIIGPRVRVGDRTSIASHTLLQNVRIGNDCVVHHGAVLGTDPQDLKFEGEETYLQVGDRTVIREYATLNRGTRAHGRTEVGADCFIMSYAHVAHDCILGDHVILSNSVNMAGHVEIGDWAIVGGVTPIHQFVRIGTHAFVGGASRVAKDIPPFLRAAGSPCEPAGLNTVGMQRRGFSEEVRHALKRAYKLFFHSHLNVTQALERSRTELPDLPEVRLFLDFIEKSERGIVL